MPKTPAPTADKKGDAGKKNVTKGSGDAAAAPAPGGKGGKAAPKGKK